MRFDLAGHMMHGPARAPSAGVERSCCLIHASIAVTKWQNADSARRCRFRKSQQKRASDLDSIDGWIPKLDVNPVVRNLAGSGTTNARTLSGVTRRGSAGGGFGTQSAGSLRIETFEGSRLSD